MTQAMNPDDLEAALIQCMLQRELSPEPVSPALRNALWRKLQRAGWQPAAHKRQERPPTTSDHALLRAFLDGDSGAFDHLMHRHLDALVGHAARSLDASDAEDAAQSAFLALYRKADRITPDVHIRGFLFRALRFEILKLLRQRARIQAPPPNPDADPHTVPDLEALVVHLSVPQVAAALETVCNPLEQRVVILALQGHGNPAIAGEVEVTSEHVRVLKHRAIARLRDHFTTSDPPAGNSP